jgi:hypothetical protein
VVFYICLFFFLFIHCSFSEEFLVWACLVSDFLGSLFSFVLLFFSFDTINNDRLRRFTSTSFFCFTSFIVYQHTDFGGSLGFLVFFLSSVRLVFWHFFGTRKGAQSGGNSAYNIIFTVSSTTYIPTSLAYIYYSVKEKEEEHPLHFGNRWTLLRKEGGRGGPSDREARRSE